MVKAEGAFAVDRRGFHVHVQAECASVKLRSPDVDQIANGLFDRAIAEDHVKIEELLEEFRGLFLIVDTRSEEHTSELQSLMRISYAVFCLKKKTPEHTQETRNSKEK